MLVLCAFVAGAFYYMDYKREAGNVLAMSSATSSPPVPSASATSRIVPSGGVAPNHGNSPSQSLSLDRDQRRYQLGRLTQSGVSEDGGKEYVS
jgi:hypothetical protein